MQNLIQTFEFTEVALRNQGLRLQDVCHLTPLQGRKKEFSLTRTHYHLHSEEVSATEGYPFPLISLPGKPLSYSLKLVPLGLSRELRYYLSSLNQTPFRINGTVTFGAFCERGDRIELGHNTLKLREAFKQNSGICWDSEVQEFLQEDTLLASETSVLIEGETGVGKTTLARQIHELSRRPGTFIHVNLSAFSRELLESELFGHVKGAYTHAYQDKLGAIREAQRGTLFLDEVDSLSWDLQTKLLLFLDDKSFRPVGATGVQKVNARLLFAAGTSGKTLEELVREGKMRKDFYFRIKSGVAVKLRPLRENQEAIDRCCDFLEGSEHIQIPTKLRELYKKCLWPGNYRQLRGHILKKKWPSRSGKLEWGPEDEALLGIPTDFLNPGLRGPEFCPTSLRLVKRDYVSKCYRHFQENVQLTAMTLEISVNTLKSYLRGN